MPCWFCGHDSKQLHDSALARRLDSIFDALTQMEKRIMTVLSDFAAKQAAFNADISDDLNAIQTAIAALNDKITALQNSQGTVTPEDQALIDDLQAKGTALAAQADALAGKQPPTPPGS